MRKIRLSHYTLANKSAIYKEQKLYSIGIMEKILRFNQEKQIIDFIIDTNKFLNDSLLEINKYNSELYNFYRQIWPFMDLHLKTEDQIKRQFDVIEDLLKRIISNTVGPNGNYFAFTFMINLIKSHLNLCHLLLIVLTRHREDSIKSQVKIIQSRLQDLLKRVENYPD